jgi:hypothetical protein
VSRVRISSQRPSFSRTAEQAPTNHCLRLTAPVRGVAERAKKWLNPYLSLVVVGKAG